MISANLPVLGFAAFSGTGKTHLLSLLIPLLKARNIRVGLIKHSHHDFDIDHPGKDSYQLRAAGATPVMLVSPFRRAIISELQPVQDIQLQAQIELFPCENLDLLLIEGFRHEAFAKIELHRPSLGKPVLYPNDPYIIAIATDAALLEPSHLPVLDLNQPQQIAEFILAYLANYPHD